MKKILLAAICCMTMMTSSVLAQNQPQRRGMRDGFRQQMFQLADTAITNQLNLTTAQQVEIAKLNENYLEEMKADGEKGKKIDKEAREARRAQMEAKRAEGRKQLRAILGTELYIEYLEKALDRRPMMMGGQRGPRPDGQNMQRSRGMRGGGSFGGEFGGRAFSEEF